MSCFMHSPHCSPLVSISLQISPRSVRLLLLSIRRRLRNRHHRWTTIPKSATSFTCYPINLLAPIASSVSDQPQTRFQCIELGFAWNYIKLISRCMPDCYAPIIDKIRPSGKSSRLRRVQLVVAVQCSIEEFFLLKIAAKERSPQIKLLIQISRVEKVNLAIFPVRPCILHNLILLLRLPMAAGWLVVVLPSLFLAAS